MLKQLSEVSNRIIIVVSGEIYGSEVYKLKKFSKEIFFRENRGYDQGAYRDVFTEYLNVEEISRYEELILCNDTFYGFFKSIKDIFKI